MRHEARTIDAERIRTQLEKAKGNVSVAAKKLGLSRRHLTRLLASDPDLKGIVTDARASRADKAEDKLTTALNKGEPWAIMFALRTLGRDRGYWDRLPDIVNATSLDALRRILIHFGVNEVSDTDILRVVMEVRAEIEAEA